MTTNAHVRPDPEPAPRPLVGPPLDPEAARVAVETWRAAVAGHFAPADAIVLACLDYVRALIQRRRLSYHFTLKDGVRLHGIDPEMARVAAGALEHWGVDLGPMGLDAAARMLAEVQRYELERAPAPRSLAEAELARARERTRTYVTVSGRQR